MAGHCADNMIVLNTIGFIWHLTEQNLSRYYIQLIIINIQLPMEVPIVYKGKHFDTVMTPVTLGKSMLSFSHFHRICNVYPANLSRSFLNNISRTVLLTAVCCQYYGAVLAEMTSSTWVQG